MVVVTREYHKLVGMSGTFNEALRKTFARIQLAFYWAYVFKTQFPPLESDADAKRIQKRGGSYARTWTGL